MWGAGRTLPVTVAAESPEPSRVHALSALRGKRPALTASVTSRTGLLAPPPSHTSVAATILPPNQCCRSPCMGSGETVFSSAPCGCGPPGHGGGPPRRERPAARRHQQRARVLLVEAGLRRGEPRVGAQHAWPPARMLTPQQRCMAVVLMHTHGVVRIGRFVEVVERQGTVLHCCILVPAAGRGEGEGCNAWVLAHAMGRVREAEIVRDSASSVVNALKRFRSGFSVAVGARCCRWRHSHTAACGGIARIYILRAVKDGGAWTATPGQRCQYCCACRVGTSLSISRSAHGVMLFTGPVCVRWALTGGMHAVCHRSHGCYHCYVCILADAEVVTAQT